MKKALGGFFAVLLTLQINAQNCDCKDNLTAVIKTTESKYIGSWFKTKGKSYNRIKQSIQKKLIERGQDCSQLLFSYLNFFQDKHIEFTETISLENYGNKNVNVDSIIKLLRYKQSELEGFWATDNNTYVISLIKTRVGYNGYLVHSGLKQYNKGDLKFQIFDINTSTPAGINFEKGKNNVLKLFNFATLTNNKIYIGLTTLKRIKFDSLNAYANKKIIIPDFSIRFDFTKETAILKVPGFGISNSKKLDSILTINDSLIKSSKTFIIDLRRNFGGNIETSYRLLDYLYTQPYVFPGACYLPISETIESIKTAANDTSDQYTAVEKKEYRELVGRLIAAKGKIICDTMRITSPVVASKIKNVAIITNRKTFSAAEIFLLVAKQSKIVTVFGEPTGGMVDFGWAFEHKLPCDRYSLALPVQTNTNYPKYAFDKKGIGPNIRLNSEEKDWIDDVIKYYEKK